MAKAKFAGDASPAQPTDEGRKGRSRTFYMTDEDYAQLSDQATRNNRSRSGQILHLIAQEDARA